MDDHSIASNDTDPTKTEDKEFSELETSYDDDDGNDEAGRPESERGNRVPRLSRVVTAAEGKQLFRVSAKHLRDIFPLVGRSLTTASYEEIIYRT